MRRCVFWLGVSLAALPLEAAAPVSRELPFSGSDVFSSLGIPAWKCEITLPRPAKAVTATVVRGSFVREGMVTEEEIKPGLGFAPALRFVRFTSGLIVLEEKKAFRLLLMDATATLEIPSGFRFDYSVSSGRGIFVGDTVIFAYEPKDKNKPVRAKEDMLRWIGLRFNVLE